MECIGPGRDCGQRSPEIRDGLAPVGTGCSWGRMPDRVGPTLPATRVARGSRRYRLARPVTANTAWRTRAVRIACHGAAGTSGERAARAASPNRDPGDSIHVHRRAAVLRPFGPAAGHLAESIRLRPDGTGGGDQEARAPGGPEIGRASWRGRV